jgi:hypothetical protein
MGYGQEVQTQQQEPEPREEQQYPYPDEGDMWAGRRSNDQSAQIREALFGMKLPKTQRDFEEWYPVLSLAIDLIARVPGYDSMIYAELNRDMEDLVDRANSQGRKKIVASKMQKFIFKIRSLVPKGDIPVAGVTGVTAMITTNSNIKQEVRMPQQHAPSSIFDGAAKLLGRGK